MTNLTSKTTPALKNLGNLHILVAEDNLLNTKLLTILLGQYGITLQAVSNGLEAVEKVKTKNFDLVLMDMEMPVMNGYQATSMIRHELKNNIPIVALTANMLPGEKEKCLALGMDGYLSKPIDAEILFDNIHRLHIKIAATKATTGEPKKVVAASDTVCNMDYLLGATGGNKKIMTSIVSVFFNETEKELTMLNEAIERNNYPVIGDISHKIKSAFSILGISTLEPVFKELEQLSGGTASKGNIEQLNQQVNTVFNQARVEMNFQHLTNGGTPASA